MNFSELPSLTIPLLVMLPILIAVVCFISNSFLLKRWLSIACCFVLLALGFVHATSALQLASIMSINLGGWELIFP